MSREQVRLLQAHEIDCRVGSVKEGSGCSLLLYKDARADMLILDEWVGSMNWTRTHEVINGNLFCNVSIYDEDKKIWITKQDVGTESNAEAEKGQASDSFKRACVNWGIGRELYTAPFIWIKFNGKEDKKTISYSKLYVSDIGYDENRSINRLEIKDKDNIVRFTMGKPIQKTNATQGKQKPIEAKPKTSTKSKPEIEEEKDTRETVIQEAYHKGIDKKELFILWKKQFSENPDTTDPQQIATMLKLIRKLEEFNGTPLADSEVRGE